MTESGRAPLSGAAQPYAPWTAWRAHKEIGAPTAPCARPQDTGFSIDVPKVVGKAGALGHRAGGTAGLSRPAARHQPDLGRSTSRQTQTGNPRAAR